MREQAPPPGWHTRKTFAAAIGASLRKVEQLLAERVIGFRQERKGSRILIPESEVARYLDGFYNPPQVVSSSRRVTR